MNPQKTLSARAWGELLLLALLWGASFLSIRIMLNEIPVLTAVFHRVLWATVALWVVIWILQIPVPRHPRIWASFAVMGLLNNIIPFGLMAWGQLTIESGLTAILNASTAIFGVAVAALVFADERLSWRKLIGVGFGFLGVATTIGLTQLVQFDPRDTAQLAVLAGALSYACAGAWARRTLSGVKPLMAATGMLTGSSLMLLPAVWLVDGPPSLTLMPQTWAAIAYVALCATAGAYLLYYRVLAAAGSGNLMLVTLLIPPIAIVLGALVLGEALRPRAFVGLALLGLGLLILNGTFFRPRD